MISNLKNLIHITEFVDDEYTVHAYLYHEMMRL